MDRITGKISGNHVCSEDGNALVAAVQNHSGIGQQRMRCEVFADRERTGCRPANVGIRCRHSVSVTYGRGDIGWSGRYVPCVVSI